jgi:predicted AAA+ superfamily ATPase
LSFSEILCYSSINCNISTKVRYIFSRDLIQALKRYVKFPVVAILGPRQSGKTTLSKHFFNKHAFVSLENPELRAFAKEDPKRFIREYDNKFGIIIDEFQYVPELLSYIQLEVDEKKTARLFCSFWTTELPHEPSNNTIIGGKSWYFDLIATFDS